MKDCIERSDAKMAFCRHMGFTSVRISVAADAIFDNIPAADVVEVVRCGECMFWDAPPSCEGLARCRTGESGVRFRKAYDFCSRGRKKMDGGVDDV